MEYKFLKINQEKLLLVGIVLLNISWRNQQIWDNINEPWLRNAANHNDIIRVVSDPNNPANLTNNKGLPSFFAREYNLLTTTVSQGGLGYSYNPLTYKYIK